MEVWRSAHLTTLASRWRADSHADLFEVEHLVARHHSGSCRIVWTLMPARYLAKAHRHLAVVHLCLVCMRNTMSRPSNGVTLRRCLISASYRIIQTGPQHDQPHAKSVSGHKPSFPQINLFGLLRRASFCIHVRRVDVDVVHLNKCRHRINTMRK